MANTNRIYGLFRRILSICNAFGVVFRGVSQSYAHRSIMPIWSEKLAMAIGKLGKHGSAPF